ncbi:MAG: hypothetical protein WEH44_06315, partial [Pirellulaceae bacterium]
LPLLQYSAAAAPSDAVVEVGSRRELFVDDLLIDALEGKAALQLHHPQPQEIAIVHDAPWEGSGSGYHSIYQDGDKYRMYYKAWHLAVAPGKVKTDTHPLLCCYAESSDGIQWTKPELGLHEFAGSKANNIVIASETIGKARVDAGHPAVFKDDNPDAPADAKYKAIVRSAGTKGVLALKSPDGIHFTLLSEEPIITDGAFDSQNLAFWDPHHRLYRAYWRVFTAGAPVGDGRGARSFRAIRTATSGDFLHWENQADLTYIDSPIEQLYTNQIKPYHRAPHILLGFPARYIDRGQVESLRDLPEPEHRQMRSSASPRYGTAITDGLFMASRDGVQFKRWNEAFLRPGIERPGTWNYGQQYLAWHLVETRSPLPDAPPELSLYASESYWTGDSSVLRRYTLRLDGFVSVSAPASGGELLTRPLSFAGRQLLVNFATSAAGELRLELQEPNGTPIPGFELEECHTLFGDAVQRQVRWKGGHNVAALAGKPLRLRAVLRDADLYAFQFTS